MLARPTVCAGLLDGFDGASADLLRAGVTAHEEACYRGLSGRPERAWQYLSSRWLLRAHLGFELGLPPLDVPVRHHDDGPPTVAGYRYQLGLSHSRARCLCLSSPQASAVGCDIEHDRPRRRVRAIAKHYFHPEEACYLAQQDAQCARRDFHRLWVLKEATAKAHTAGLGGGLRSPAFVLQPRLCCIDAPVARGRWTFAVATDGECSLALIADAAVAPVRFRIFRYMPTMQGPARHVLESRADIATFEPGVSG